MGGCIWENQTSVTKSKCVFHYNFASFCPKLTIFLKIKIKFQLVTFLGVNLQNFSCLALLARHILAFPGMIMFGRQRKIPRGRVIFWVFYLVGATLWGWLLTECPTEMQSCTDVFGNAAVVIKHFAFPALLMPFEDGLLKKCRQTTIFCFFFGSTHRKLDVHRKIHQKCG